jgi:haloalkane dehalogenase
MARSLDLLSLWPAVGPGAPHYGVRNNYDSRKRPVQQIFVEMFKYNDNWAGSTPEFRAEYIGQVQEVLSANGPVVGLGIEIITYSFNESTAARRAPYDFFCVYRVPSEEVVRQLESMIEGSGWYEYFDQVNLGGATREPATALSAHQSLETSAASR